MVTGVAKYCDHGFVTNRVPDFVLHGFEICDALLSSYDFDELVEETLEEKVRICEQQREVEDAMATEKFFRESYDNLLNMECGPSHLPKISEEERKETEKFLADSWYNLLHMFDDENSSETGNLGQYLADIYTTTSSNASSDPQENIYRA
ncbi:hypothetical protein CCACVL1_09154 [Corchorus capsularis]|uniref:Uncharacterized protein n=1 Tax=Corchorus capsularis TaxID=210143 RepID=A0A1R3IXH1_COCAP|nr:hypothetical protein CCACVL1_09154 [Corchorus capsularis]